MVGSSGSGKTTVASAIAERLGIAHLELDAIHHLPGWRERDHDEFRQLVFEFAARPRWVMDGNYGGRLGDRLDDLVDTYVWLDLPRWQATTATLARTIRRSLTREELWGTGNRERLTSLVRSNPVDNIVLWSWTRHDSYRDRYETKLRTGQHRWIRLRSRREVKRFLDELG